MVFAGICFWLFVVGWFVVVLFCLLLFLLLFVGGKGRRYSGGGRVISPFY